MEAIFSKAVIKDYKDKSRLLHLEPDINDRLAHCRNPVELEYIWESWRNETGRKLKMFYPRYIQLMNKAAALNGFHEAIGDTIALSVATPDHIRSLGLQVDHIVNSHENEINFLFLMALQKIAFLPYALVVESWRWSVFKGDINLENYNKHWWELRMKYQGIQPPKLRSEDNFDAGGKYHIAAGVPYIRYFVSFVIQFQFHEALCKKAGQINNKPLHKCDIYKSHKAGELLRETLSLGKSVPWSEVMLKFTQTKDISASSLLKYFDPLKKWLKEENEKKNIKIGWDNNHHSKIKL